MHEIVALGLLGALPFLTVFLFVLFKKAFIVPLDFFSFGLSVVYAIMMLAASLLFADFYLPFIRLPSFFDFLLLFFLFVFRNQIAGLLFYGFFFASKKRLAPKAPVPQKFLPAPFLQAFWACFFVFAVLRAALPQHDVLALALVLVYLFLLELAMRFRRREHGFAVLLYNQASYVFMVFALIGSYNVIVLIVCYGLLFYAESFKKHFIGAEGIKKKL